MALNDQYSSIQNEEEKISITISDDDIDRLNHTELENDVPKQCKTQEDSNERLLWRTQYDNSLVPYQQIYSESDGYGEHFGVKLKWVDVESLCTDMIHDPDNATHQQRLHYFEKVPLDKIIIQTYNTVCKWHPVGKSIDNMKWVKLARNMKFLSAVKNSNHEVDMAFFRHSHERRLKLEQFQSTLKDMALLRFPIERYNENEAISNMVWATIAMLPKVNEFVWSEAKKLAIKEEMRRQCAQIRIATFFHHKFQRAIFMRSRRASTSINKMIRGIAAFNKRLTMLQAAGLDRTFRIRYASAVVCQKAWRKFCSRQRLKTMKEENIMSKQFVFYDYIKSLKMQKKRKEEFVFYRQVLKIQSTYCIATMTLKYRSYLNQQAIVGIEVYLPETRKTFHFSLQETDVRECLEKALGQEESLSWNEMLNPKALEKLTTRLIARNINGNPIILLCRRHIAEKGNLIAKRLVRFDKSLFVIHIYRSSFDIVLRVHEPSTCDQLRMQIRIHLLIEWLNQVERESQKDILRIIYFARFANTLKQSNSDAQNQKSTPNDEMPSMLKKHREGNLVEWILQRIHLHRDDVSGVLNMTLQYEAESERIEKVVKRIQSTWRQRCAKIRAKEQIHLQYEKLYDRSAKKFFYNNIKTGERQWYKPTLLGNEDIRDPPDEWRKITYYDPETNCIHTYYFNPYTGQESILSEEDAARMVQRRFRQSQRIDLIGSKLDFSDVAKAVSIIRSTEIKYEQYPERLANRVNFALLSHCLHFKFDTAETLYKDAIDRSPCHPVIARAYGIFLLARCSSTHQPTFDMACRLFKEASAADPNQTMFETAKDNFFHWSVLMNPNNEMALLNYALLHQCILQDYRKAERIYLRALSVDPVNQFTIHNFDQFLDQRYPGGHYGSNEVPMSIIHRSYEVEKRIEWDYWIRMEDPLCTRKQFRFFWYDTQSRISSFNQPRWKRL